MGRRSWIHLIRSKTDHDKIMEFTDKNDIIFIVGAALIEGVLHSVEYFNCGDFGEEGKRSLVLLTQSDGSSIIEEMIEKSIIEDWSLIFLLDDIRESELENTENGFKIKKATYLSKEDYEHHLELLEKETIYNKLRYQKEKEIPK